MKSMVVRVARHVLIGLAGLAVMIVLLQIIGIPIIESHVTVRTSSTDNEAEETLQLSLQGMDRARKGSVVVYHRAIAMTFVMIALETFQKALKTVENKMGLEDLSLKVALFDRERYESVKGRTFRVSGQVWPLFVSENWKHLEDADDHVRNQLYWTLPHEAVESRVGPTIYLIDSRARWIGDGLAELAAFHVARHQAPDIACAFIGGRLEQVREIIQSRRHRYNLVEDFPTRSASDAWTALERAGYGVAFAFWYELVRQHGNATIKSFWKEFQSQFRLCILTWCLMGPDSQDAARLLTQLTGDPVWRTIQNVDLNHTAEILEKARTMISGNCE